MNYDPDDPTTEPSDDPDEEPTGFIPDDHGSDEYTVHIHSLIPQDTNSTDANARIKMFAYIGGGVLLLILLMCVVYCCCCGSGGDYDGKSSRGWGAKGSRRGSKSRRSRGRSKSGRRSSKGRSRKSASRRKSRSKSRRS